MSKYSNEWYTQGLLAQNTEAINSIFSEFLPAVSDYICKNSGTREDAKDIFMYAVETIYVKLKNNDLTLTAGFFTYLFEICKRQWLKKIRGDKFSAKVTSDDPAVSSKMGSEQDTYFSENNERKRLFEEKFAKLAKDCKMVLTYAWHTEMDMNQIATAMGWTYGYARKRKHECKETLITAVKNDHRYTELRA